MNKLVFFLGALFGVWMGWFLAINYSIDLIDRRASVLKIEDWSRLKELRDQLVKDRVLFL